MTLMSKDKQYFHHWDKNGTDEQQHSGSIWLARTYGLRTPKGSQFHESN